MGSISERGTKFTMSIALITSAGRRSSSSSEKTTKRSFSYS